MKKLLLALALFFIFQPAFADKIQGHFFCDEKYPDGSGEKFTLKVRGNKMSYLRVGDDPSWAGEWKEVYFSDYIDEQYTIFIMSKNTSQMIYVLSPTEDKNKISTTYINTATYKDKSMVAHGRSDRI